METKDDTKCYCYDDINTSINSMKSKINKLTNSYSELQNLYATNNKE